MNVSQTNPLRRFSAMIIVIPVSIPITSLSYQFFSGLKAFTNPYRLHAPRRILPHVRKHAQRSLRQERQRPRRRARHHRPVNRTCRGGPPHTTYPFFESDAVMPHKSSL